AHWQEVLGIVFDLDRLRETVRLSNQARALALEVATLREATPAPLRGSGMRDQLAVLTAMFGHPSGVRYYRALRDYTARRIADRQPEQAHQRVRLYWMHLMPYFESALLSILEDELGGVIAWEEISTLWWEELDERTPLRSLARKMVSLFFNGPIQRRAEMALRLIRRYHCQGAIHFSHWGCRQSAGALYVLRAQLRREGVPLLILDGDCVDPSNLPLGPLRTRIEAFMEMLA
ncbi:MAG: 2-hydroxyacyl-CoA dehydratase family protein, partial [Anaerolineae bacterium]|nr:2-hydroxyacyl-CoA dehydratase family protein [Anaerolineae bacterium]